MPEAAKRTRKRAVWRLMTDIEQRAARALAPCRFAPGTPVKKFAAALLDQADFTEAMRDIQGLDPELRTPAAALIGLPAAVPGNAALITDKQAALLWSYCWHFRRQIKDPAVINGARSRALMSGIVDR